MIKAIFYKEWIKTKWIGILSFLVLIGFTLFLVFNLHRMVELKGAIHIWDVILQRNALFINLITYVPAIIGILFSLIQFIPEMQRKSLKLTLHLPYDSTKMIAQMVSYGVIVLTIIFTLSWLLFYLVMSRLLVYEMMIHILLTATVWYVAGLFTYLFTAWIVLEPTWKRRILNTFITLLLLKIFYLGGEGGAYNAFLPYMIVFTLLSSSLIFLSVSRFKEGKQD